MGSERDFKPKMVGIICNWCCYGGADLCGVSRFQYPPFIRLIRVMCSGRVDPLHIFRAFSKGLDAVFVGGCHINDCHYVTEGNYDALAMVTVCKKLLERLGVRPERLRLEWVSAGEGVRFAGIMNEYAAQMQELGPLGKGEGLAPEELKFRLEAATRILPWLRLVLAQRLRVSPRTEAAYHAFFQTPEFDRLFEELVADKLVASELTLLLSRQPATTAELAQRLGLTAAEVSRHLRDTSRQGLVRYDTAKKSYSLA